MASEENRIMNETENVRCGICGETNDDIFVQCLQCKSYFHEKCVVDNDNMTTWKCDLCKNLAPPPAPKSIRSRSIRSRASTSMSQRLALEQLKEEELLLQESLNEKYMMKKQFLQKKYEILQQEGSRASGSSISSREKVQDWMDKSVGISSAPAPTLSSTIVESNVKTLQVPGKQSEGLIEQSPVTKEVIHQKVIVNSTAVHTKPITFSGNEEPNNDLSVHPNRGQQSRSSVTFAAPVESTIHPSGSSGNQTAINHHNISKLAIAARQVIPKELPNFSGKPSEWLQFIGAYDFTTDACEIQDYENSARLQKCLRGIAFDSVRHVLYRPGGASMAIETLREMFGEPKFIIDELLEDIRSSEKLQSNDYDSILHFILKVENISIALKQGSLFDEMRSSSLLRELANHLPNNMFGEWADVKSEFQISDIEMFSKWLNKKKKAILGVLDKAPLQPKKTLKKEHVNLHQESSTFNAVCSFCGNNCSSLVECKAFNDEVLSKRWEFIRQRGFCRTCLKPHVATCTKVECGVNNCKAGHHKLLHNYTSLKRASSVEHENNINLHHKEPQLKTFFKILPITLSWKDRQVSTYAILDDCSSLTLMEQSLSESLGLSGQIKPLHLKWTGDATRTDHSSKTVCVEISGANCSKKYKLDRVRTISNLDLPKQTQNINDFQKYQHLKGLVLPSFSEAVPQMLIGLTHAKLLSASKIKVGNDDEPLAAKTPLGWVVYGGINCNDSRVLHINEQVDSFIEDEVHKYFSLEASGVSANYEICSTEEMRAKDIMNKTTIFRGSWYEIGLLWKYDSFKFPPSYEMAKHRLQHLEKKLEKDPDLAQCIQQQIEEYLQKGYASIVPKENVNYNDISCWYLPIFVVKNPNKPKKIRLVWDAAAKIRNISLNSMLLKGPDTLLSLPGILRRFREHRIAFCGDIKEMFHQVHVRQEDRKFQRFLYRFPGDKEPSVLEMNVMTFGATCSPACANYILSLNADRFQNSHPKAASSIKSSHYVDDLLEGCNSTEEAIQLALDVKAIHKSGGFDIRNWSSNDKKFTEVLNGTPSNIKSNDVELQLDSTMEKVLGLWWNTSTDCFTFLLKFNKSNSMILTGAVVPSKRDILRTLMSIFDPLGLLSHFLINPKILLQEIWRLGLSWDEPIPENLYSQWKLWVNSLQNIENLSIPRWYGVEPNYPVELHTFVDASEEAYSCAIFIRLCHQDFLNCVLVAGKSKVAPLKPLSMPRLELQAALIGTRMAANVKNDHKFAVSKEYYWSDSVTVLSWLNSDARKYRQFVAVRVGEILELSKVSDWRWVPSKMNVADLATRKITHDLRFDCPWFNGPAFLYESETNWPINKKRESVREEIRTQYLTERINFHAEATVNTQGMSDWRRARRSQAYVLRFIHNCKIKCAISTGSLLKGPLIRSEYIAAQNCLFIKCQEEGFPEEVACLQKSPPVAVPRSSPMYKDSPYMDSAGVIRSNSRLANAIQIPEDVKKPIYFTKKA